MLSESLKTHVEDLLEHKISEVKALAGGDINAVYRLSTANQTYVIKLNDAQAFPDMFPLEKSGLEHIAATKTLPVPHPLLTGVHQNQSFLLLDYLKSAPKSAAFDQTFGMQLAALHKHTAAFGFEKDNYIGSLPQYNTREGTALEFYIHQRLEPQFNWARNAGYSFNNIPAFYKNLEDLIPEEPAALIHGDLWSGNYLVNPQGLPALIDPATCYAPREMDLAMMHLFGGFSEEIFRTYHEAFPLQPEWKNRLKIWQLYYILVHVNIFGGHYYSSAQEILKTFA